MGILDFLKKKKEDEFLDIGAEVSAPGGYGPATPGQQPMQQPMQQPQPGFGDFPAQPMQQTRGGDEILKRDIETLNYKFDSLKATLDQINARLANIEQGLKGQWQY